MRDSIRELIRGRDVERNLAKYPDVIERLYYEFCYTRMAFDYYFVYEDDEPDADDEEEITVGENSVKVAAADNEETAVGLDSGGDAPANDEKTISGADSGRDAPADDDGYLVDRDSETEMFGIFDDLHRVIRDCALSEDMTCKDARLILENIRFETGRRLEALKYFAESLLLYEDVLKYRRYQFEEGSLEEDYSDEEFCRELMRYIFSDDDNSIINETLQVVLGDLPVRLTKAKFFEYLRSALLLYTGADCSSVKIAMERIRYATLQNTENEDEYVKLFPQTGAFLKTLKQTDFSRLSHETYSALYKKTTAISDRIVLLLNLLTDRIKLLNDVCVVTLTKGGEPDFRAKKNCDIILRAVNDYYLKGVKVPEETEDVFEALEGVQESAYGRIIENDVTDELISMYSDVIAKKHLEERFRTLRRLQKLSTDFLSVGSENDDDDDNTTADAAFMENEADRLESDLRNFFSCHDRHVNRRVMARAMSEIPVFFDHMDDIQNYIYQSLSGCTDIAEKTACVEQLRSKMYD